MVEYSINGQVQTWCSSKGGARLRKVSGKRKFTVINHEVLSKFAYGLIPILDYSAVVWKDCGATLSKRADKLQNRAVRILLHYGKRGCSQDMRNVFMFSIMYNEP